jgi:MFS family permease
MQCGIVVSIVGIGATLGSLIGGALSDYISPRKICLVALFSNSVILLLFGLSNNFITINLFAFLLGFANASYSPTSRTMLMSTVTSAYHNRISGIRYMAVNVGVGLGTFVGGLIATINFSYVFKFNAIFILIAAIIMLFTKEDNLHEMNKEINTAKAQPIPHYYSYLWAMFAVLLFFALIFAQIKTAYPLYLQNVAGLSEHQFASLFIVNTLLIVVFQVPLINFLTRYSEELVIGVGALLIGVGMFIMLIFPGYLNAIISAMVWTLGEMLCLANIQSYIYNLAPEGHKGKALGLFQAIYFFTNIIGPVGGTWLYEIDKGETLWTACLISGTIACSICIVLYYLKNRAWQLKPTIK